MLQALVEKVADLWTAPDRWIEAEQTNASPAPVTLALPNAAFRRQFLDLARYRQRQHGKVVSGLLTIVWQGGKSRALGPHYRDLKVLAGMVTEVVLEQMLAQPDFFFPHDPDTVVLCFASANRAVVELRATMMAQALRGALVQRAPDLAGKMRVDVIVTAVEPVDLVTKDQDLVIALVDLLSCARNRQVILPPTLSASAKPV